MGIRKYIPNNLINYGKHLPEATLANLKYGFPGRRLKVIGVTGTDGKTTTVNMIFKILKDAGKKVSMISTINAEIAGKRYDTGFHVTSPHPMMIQKFLSQSVKNRDEFFVMEVTSHALEQFRVWGVSFEIGVITNVTHEHLDYHKTFKNYLNAKAKLLKSVKIAILNRDDENYEFLSKKTSGEIVTFGLHTNAQINIKNYPIKLKIPGDYNKLNALAAAAVAINLNIDKQDIAKSLETFSSLPGRMEEVENKKGFKVFVDFAHTPNALESSLVSLRNQTSGRLISVFGCASQRDVQKRPVMGVISTKMADITILTDEDPRFEDSMRIIDEISRGAIAHGAKIGTNLFIEPDRQKAIQKAINIARKGDVIGIFGKGHETSMNYKGKEMPWSDVEAVKKALKYGSKD